ncbi:hypothetical protein LCGC14_1486510 [marine sediment metagenome]|uniref:Uncharacterized protein n=1 Tax=marine sediment metagenome TaxID=412755 RepID=A0A0F9J7Z2_9ZZZZ
MKRTKSKHIQPTLFMLRDLRTGEEEFKQVDRKTYKMAARKSSEAGVPIRTGVHYIPGRAVKTLTIMEKR